MTRFQQVQVKHCYRQANHCVNLMARLGAEQELEYRLFSSPPVDLAKALEDDCNGVFSNRLCTEQVIFFFSFNEIVFYQNIYIYIRVGFKLNLV